ncbi:hypothetical protein [Nocardia nova]|uniref:hypothetical protein n=1 Tax=Nocardia nova TaxID=37330 RepID=UPI0015E2D17C|nr:hypothetical protein [Nocardia nova]
MDQPVMWLLCDSFSGAGDPLEAISAPPVTYAPARATRATPVATRYAASFA